MVDSSSLVFWMIAGFCKGESVLGSIFREYRSLVSVVLHLEICTSVVVLQVRAHPEPNFLGATMLGALRRISQGCGKSIPSRLVIL
jgi:hypothetical protein